MLPEESTIAPEPMPEEFCPETLIVTTAGDTVAETASQSTAVPAEFACAGAEVWLTRGVVTEERRFWPSTRVPPVAIPILQTMARNRAPQPGPRLTGAGATATGAAFSVSASVSSAEATGALCVKLASPAAGVAGAGRTGLGVSEALCSGVSFICGWKRAPSSGVFSSGFIADPFQSLSICYISMLQGSQMRNIFRRSRNRKMKNLESLNLRSEDLSKLGKR